MCPQSGTTLMCVCASTDAVVGACVSSNLPLGVMTHAPPVFQAPPRGKRETTSHGSVGINEALWAKDTKDLKWTSTINICRPRQQGQCSCRNPIWRIHSAPTLAAADDPRGRPVQLLSRCTWRESNAATSWHALRYIPLSLFV